jgi:heme exporter protein C
MAVAMFSLALACWMYTIAVALTRVRTIILEREKNAVWINDLIGAKS